MTDPRVDPDDPTGIDWEARTASAVVPFLVVDGRPVNPGQRTGRTGRGRLRRWGENQAADAVVIAVEDGQRWVLLVDRSDGQGWAIPGGRVEPGEDVLDAATRELAEETGVSVAHLPGRVVYAGFVADPRNTDEAWMVSTVMVFHLVARVPVAAGDDARDARWFRFGDMGQLADDVFAAGGFLFPAHPPLLRAVLDALGG